MIRIQAHQKTRKHEQEELMEILAQSQPEEVNQMITNVERVFKEAIEEAERKTAEELQQKYEQELERKQEAYELEQKRKQEEYELEQKRKQEEYERDRENFVLGAFKKNLSIEDIEEITGLEREKILRIKELYLRSS